MRPILASTPNSTLTSSTIGTSLKIGRAENNDDGVYFLFLFPEYGYLQGFIFLPPKALDFQSLHLEIYLANLQLQN